MRLATWAWLAARLRARRGRQLDFPERRRELVRRLAPGRSSIVRGDLHDAELISGLDRCDESTAGERR